MLLDNNNPDSTRKQLASRLGIPLTSEAEDSDGLLLQVDENGRLGIGFARELVATRGGIHSSSAWFYPGFSARYAARGRDPLMRAVGYKTRTVLDCTAGWAVDAAHFARHGISVTAVEQHAIVSALLESALAGCNEPKLIEHFNLVFADSYSYLQSMADQVEVIYIDPMYPPRPGSAAPRRPLRILQALTGSGGGQIDDGSAKRLLSLARRRATRRVVVKRPHYAASLDNDVSGSITAKLVRFDLYPPVSS